MSPRSPLRLSETETEVLLSPTQPPQAAVIWLHGLGADGHDFVPIVGELGFTQAERVQFVFPHAPVRKVTLNGGMPMRAWYDIYGLNRDGPQDAEGIEASRARIAARIGALVDAGVPASRIVLAGFSQGGAIALHTALRARGGLAGLLPLSTYLPLFQQLTVETVQAPRDLPILMMHGLYDPILPVNLGRASCDYVRQLGYTVDWREYPMQHQVCLEQLEAVGGWLRQVLPLSA